MSRVDDDRDAARMAARLQEAKRAEESKKSQKAAEGNAFSKLVGKQKEQSTQMSQQASQHEKVGRDAIAHLLEQAEAHGAENTHLQEKGQTSAQQEAGFKGKLGQQQKQEHVSTNAKHDGDAATKTKLADDQGTTQTAQSRGADQSTGSKNAEGRKNDAKVSREAIEERKESSDSHASSTGGAKGAKGEKGELKTDTDKGGGQQGGGSKDGKDGAASANPGFRFNPALQVPVPVAKPKENTGSERLRKIASELAQKIVERVRVGTNAAGRMEFQIDLRQDVLAGLSVKVSSHNGKIKATFSGSDRDVLKMIEEQGETLKKALAARGLSLEDFKVEART